MQTPKDRTITRTNTSPQGNGLWSSGPSSQYRSQVKYQQTARFISSSIFLKSSKERCTKSPAIQSRTKNSHLFFNWSNSSVLQFAFIRCISEIFCCLPSTGGRAESTKLSHSVSFLSASFSSSSSSSSSWSSSTTSESEREKNIDYYKIEGL